MPDAPEQLPIDLDAIPAEVIAGGMPLDPQQRLEAERAFYRRFLDELMEAPTCLAGAGVHIYPDHTGTSPCMCGANRPSKGAP